MQAGGIRSVLAGKHVLFPERVDRAAAAGKGNPVLRGAHQGQESQVIAEHQAAEGAALSQRTADPAVRGFVGADFPAFQFALIGTDIAEHTDASLLYTRETGNL